MPTLPPARRPDGSSPSQTDVVIERIKAMITDGRLGAGSRLPIEKDLAAELAVSRGSLREGVRALAIMGVLETRQGDGTYVTSLDPELLLAPMGFMVDLQTPANAAHLQAVRRVLETEAAGRAALRMSEADLAEAAAVLDSVEPLIDGDVSDHEAVMNADIEFHRIISRASANPALDALIEALASRTIRARLWRAISDRGAVQETQLEHRAILTELVGRDPDRARIRMANHLLGVEEFMDSHPTQDIEPHAR
ncbi:FadR/GntR family transcriptional regulator [Glaciihabitans sp. UYNi722]|uniref:FadR/GntR family transcriptional regulator n=1 Tax=Glaciihabitans sp. UYNi722 TaxID=3156344 RepID=UPI00339285AD